MSSAERQMVGLLDRRLVFVTGKGGVGKTTVAAGLALFASEHGRRTLLCEVDAKGDVASFFETGPTCFTAREVLPSLWAMSMDTEASLREYLRLNLRIPVVGRIGPLAKAFDFVATAAPGVREILTVGKLCYEVRERPLRPRRRRRPGHRAHRRAAGRPPGHQRAREGRAHPLADGLDARDPVRSRSDGLVIVTTPEEMPVNETIELAERVATETTVELAAVIVNRVLPELFGRSEEEVFNELCGPAASAELEQLRAATTPPPSSTRPAWRSPCAGRVPGISSACARGSTPPSHDVPAVPLRPPARAAHPPPGGGSLGEELAS